MNFTTMTAAIAVIVANSVLADVANPSGLYEATGEFMIETQRYSQGGVSADAGRGYAELVSTRFPEWRSEKLVSMILRLFRASHPQSTISDEEILETLANSEFKMHDGSRIITICVRSGQPVVAAALANTYVSAIMEYTEDQNRMRRDMAAASLHALVEKKQREVDQLHTQLLDFRFANKLDALHASRDMIRESINKTTKDILELESQEVQQDERVKLMRSVQKDPEKFGGILADVPRVENVANEYRALQKALVEYKFLLDTRTEAHPEVVACKKWVDRARQGFIDAVGKSITSGDAMLEHVRSKLGVFRKKRDDLVGELSSAEQRIIAVEAGVAKLESKLNVAQDVLKSLIMEENNARIKAEANDEKIRVVRPAVVPTRRKGLLK